MKLQRRRFLHLAAAAAVLPAASRMAVAQSYPDRPVRVVVPYAPGGPTDVVTRLIAQKLSERSGKQFYVENIGGGGGNIAMGRVAKMAPDGYTLLMVNPSYVVNPTLYRDPPYRFEKDFDPVSLAVLTTLVITVHPSVPAQTLSRTRRAYQSQSQEIQLRIAWSGHSRSSRRRDLPPFAWSRPRACAVQQRGSGGCFDVGGHTPICFASPSPAAQQVIEGKLRGLAVTSVARSQALPDVPTTAEAGYPAVAGDNWQGIVVPSGTPKATIDYLHREIVEIMALPDVKARLAVLGFEPVASTPEELLSTPRPNLRNGPR